MSYIVSKGFISIDGTSLTICDVDYKASWFTFMLIPHTQQNIIVPQKEIGDLVNIEIDVLAKVVDQRMSQMFSIFESKLETLKENEVLLKNRIDKLETSLYE